LATVMASLTQVLAESRQRRACVTLSDIIGRNIMVGGMKWLWLPL
jgi:hypothetical protein